MFRAGLLLIISRYSNWHLLCVYIDWLLASIPILLTANQHKRMIDTIWYSSAKD